MLPRWISTVRGLIPSRTPISVFESPWTISSSTARSRRLNWLTAALAADLRPAYWARCAPSSDNRARHASGNFCKRPAQVIQRSSTHGFDDRLRRRIGRIGHHGQRGAGFLQYGPKVARIAVTGLGDEDPPASGSRNANSSKVSMRKLHARSPSDRVRQANTCRPRSRERTDPVGGLSLTAFARADSARIPSAYRRERP